MSTACLPKWPYVSFVHSVDWIYVEEKLRHLPMSKRRQEVTLKILVVWWVYVTTCPRLVASAQLSSVLLNALTWHRELSAATNVPQRTSFWLNRHNEAFVHLLFAAEHLSTDSEESAQFFCMANLWMKMQEKKVHFHL